MYKKLFVLSALVLASCSKEIIEPDTNPSSTVFQLPEIRRDYTSCDVVQAPFVDYNKPSSETQGTAIHLNYDSHFDPLWIPADLAFLDYNGDGIMDAVSGNSHYPNSFADMYSRQAIKFLKGNCDGTLSLDISITFDTLSNPGPEHGRKSLIGDFNLDGSPDIFLVGHGTDAPPHEGEYQMCLMSDGVGGYDLVKYPEVSAFFHTGASVDIDDDGDLDIYLAAPGKQVLMRNDNGTLVPTTPPYTFNSYPISLDYIDLDGDGKVEMIYSTTDYVHENGHQDKGYLRTSTGKRYFIPSITNFGVPVAQTFYDADGDGIKEIFIARTGSYLAAQGNYMGVAIQVLKYIPGKGLEDYSEIITGNIKPQDEVVGWIKVVDSDKDGNMELICNTGDKDYGWEQINGVFRPASFKPIF